MIDLLFGYIEKKISNSDFSLLPVPLVSSIKYQSKLRNSLLADSQCLDRAIFCLQPTDFNNFSLKLVKYLKFPNSHFCVKI